MRAEGAPASDTSSDEASSSSQDASQAEGCREVDGGRWNRWATLVAGIFLMLVSGSVFTFGSIGGQVKEALGATEAEAQLIGVAGNVGLWTNVVGGLLLEKIGARPTMLLGGALASAGCGVLSAAIRLKAPPAVAALGWLAAGHGSGWLYISTLFANMSNFHVKERGFVVGIMACFFGASSAVLVALLGGCLGGHFSGGACEGGFMGGSVQTYTAFLAVCIPAVVVPGALLTSTSETEPAPSPDCERAPRRFGAVAALAMALVAVISGSNLFAALKDPSVKTWSNYAVLLLLAPLLLVPLGTGPCWTSSEEQEFLRTVSAQQSLIGLAGRPPTASIGTNFTPSEAARTSAFWTLWAGFGFTVGGDITTLNFLASIAEARSLGDDVPRLCVVVAMSCDAASRFATGTAASRGAPLLGLLALGPLLLIAAQGVLLCDALVGVTPLYAACALLGVSDGAMWSAGPLLVGQAFGLRSAGRIFGLVVLAAAGVTLALMLGVEPRVYKAHAPPGGGPCRGPECFRLTHIIIGACGAMAACSVLALALRKR